LTALENDQFGRVEVRVIEDVEGLDPELHSQTVTSSAGAKLGPYEILSAIGAGGQGEVYRARDTRLNRTVVIKVLSAHFSDNAEMKARFEREAQTIAGLNHPHICVLYDVGQQGGTDYLVMEYVEGQTLSAIPSSARRGMFSRTHWQIETESLPPPAATHWL